MLQVTTGMSNKLVVEPRACSGYDLTALLATAHTYCMAKWYMSASSSPSVLNMPPASASLHALYRWASSPPRPDCTNSVSYGLSCPVGCPIQAPSALRQAWRGPCAYISDVTGSPLPSTVRIIATPALCSASAASRRRNAPRLAPHAHVCRAGSPSDAQCTAVDTTPPLGVRCSTNALVHAHDAGR